MKKKPKNYYVTITHQYLLEAFDDVEAILRAKERFMGRPNDVYFDGMIINAVVTKRPLPKEKPIIPREIKKKGYKTLVHEIIREVDNGYKPNIARDRQDSKEQDYIHFSAADGV